MRCTRSQLVTIHQRLQRNTSACDTAFDSSYGNTTDFRRFFIGKASCPNENERLALRLWQSDKRTFNVAQFDLTILTRWCSKETICNQIVPFTREARPAHLRQEEVAQDNECPGAHVRARLKPSPRRPGF